MDREPENRVLGFESAVKKWLHGKVNKTFIHFLSNSFPLDDFYYEIHLMIFKSGTHYQRQ